jgi:hypothetical protein
VVRYAKGRNRGDIVEIVDRSTALVGTDAPPAEQAKRKSRLLKGPR